MLSKRLIACASKLFHDKVIHTFVSFQAKQFQFSLSLTNDIPTCRYPMDLVCAIILDSDVFLYENQQELQSGWI